jgi:ubiquinone/menaquinone biosynthesis C-methylase UbiE
MKMTKRMEDKTYNFYDIVVRKFGASGFDGKRIMDYPEGDPEAVFEEKLVELSGKEKVALDVGCGDGGFAIRMAAHFRQITGIDNGEERLKLAVAEQRALGVENVRFEKQDAQHTTFAEDTFNVVYSRRGPTFYHEFFRITKPGGYFLTIGIGEKDAWGLKEIFGRGQGFWTWKSSALEQAKENLQREGFVELFGQDLLFDEYYASYDDINRFLQGVPIFEDFDLEKDRRYLETYVAKFQTEKGIYLPRHRFVTVAMKERRV